MNRGRIPPPSNNYNSSACTVYPFPAVPQARTIQYDASHTSQPFPIPYSEFVSNDSPVSPAFFSTTKNHGSSCQYYAVAYSPIRRGFVCVCSCHRRREHGREGWRQRWVMWPFNSGLTILPTILDGFTRPSQALYVRPCPS